MTNARTLKIMKDNATFITPPSPPPYRRACRAPLRMMKIVTVIAVITDDDDEFCFRIYLITTGDESAAVPVK